VEFYLAPTSTLFVSSKREVDLDEPNCFICLQMSLDRVTGRLKGSRLGCRHNECANCPPKYSSFCCSHLSSSGRQSYSRISLSRFKSLLLLKMRLLPVLAIAASVGAQKCPLQFDGRVRKDATLATFDGSSSPFNAQYVLGASK